MTSRDAQAVIEDGEEVGGFVKTQRTKRPLDERPGNNKTPRHQETRVIVLGETQAQAAQEKNLEGEMKNNETPGIIAQTRPEFEFEICPRCGFFNKAANNTKDGEPIRYLVCKGCDDKYLLYAKKVAGELVEGKKPEVLSKVEWVLAELDLERFERELEAARKTRTNAEARIDEKIRITANGKALPKEIFIELRAQYHQQVSRDDYFLVRRLYARLEAARKLKLELEQVIAEKATKAAEAAKNAEAPTGSAPPTIVPTT